jgi:hypothetical protein
MPAKVIKDSISEDGHRLITVEATFHRFILAEVNTHRMWSRSSASSRAIPVSVAINRIKEDLAYPVQFGTSKKGMQSGPPLEGENLQVARQIWRDAAETAIRQADRLLSLGVHKEVINRLLEPFSWHTAIISATDWDNFFDQRCSPLAQPEMRLIADAIRDAIKESRPELVKRGHWHLPYIEDEEREWALKEAGGSHADALRLLQAISAARCARVSYLTHDGVRDPMKDVELYSHLVSAVPPHHSPLEHCATPALGPNLGNFKGWHQLRHVRTSIAMEGMTR